MKKELIKGAKYSVIVKIFNIFFTFIMGVLLARVLGPESFGVFSYIIAIITVLSIPVSSGLSNFLVKFISEYNTLEKWGELKGVIFWANKQLFSLSLIIVLGLYLYTYFFVEDVLLRFLLFLAGPIIVMYSLGVIRSGALKGLKYILISLLPEKIIARGVIILFLSYFFLIEKSIGVEIAVLIYLFAELIAFLFGHFCLLKILRPKLKKVEPKFDKSTWLKVALPMMLAGSLQISNNKIDVFILGFFTEKIEIGFYEVAFKGAMFVSFAQQALNLFIAPYFSSFSKVKDTAKLQKIISKSGLYCFSSALLLFLIFIVFGKSLISIVYGDDYINSYLLLIYLGFAQLVNVGFGPIIQFLSMSGGQNHVVIATGLTIIFNILLNFILIPIFGVTGAAISLILSYFIRNSYMLYFSINKFNLDTSIVGSIRYSKIK